MNKPADKNVLIILLLSIVVFASNIWGISIYVLDEAKNASCAMEMLQRSDWVVPTFNGELRTDKPPFHYYLMMLAYLAGGVNPFTARIFQSLAGVFLVVFIYRFLKTRINQPTALVTSLIMLSSFQLHVQFHLAVPDPFLIFWFTLTLLSFFDFLQGNPKAWKWIFIGAGFGFLTKGPIAVVLPGLIAVVYLMLTKNLNISTIMRLRPLHGLLIFLLIALPWYVAVGMETQGVWLRGFFLQHNIGRFTSTMEGHRGYFLVPPLVLLFALFPFSLFIVTAARQAWRDKGLSLFALTAALVVVLFFMFSKTFLPGYVSPAIPFLAVVLGKYLAANFQWSRVWLWIVPVTFLVGAGLAGGLVYAVYRSPDFPDARKLVWFALILPASFGLSGYYLLRRKPKTAFASIVAGWVAFSLVFYYLIIPVVDAQNPVRMSERIRKAYAQHRPIAYGLFNPAFVFAYKSVIPQFHDIESLFTYLEEHPESMIFTRGAALEQLNKDHRFRIIFRQRDLMEQSETVILVPERTPAVH